MRDETVSSCSHTSPWEGSCVGGAAGPEKGSTPGQESGYGEAVVQETIGWWRTEIIISVDGAAASIRFTLGGDPSTVQQSKGKGGEVQRAVTPPRLTSRTRAQPFDHLVTHLASSWTRNRLARKQGAKLWNALFVIVIHPLRGELFVYESDDCC